LSPRVRSRDREWSPREFSQCSCKTAAGRRVTAEASILLRVSRRRREMYSGHGRLCVCASVPRRIPTLLHGLGYKLVEW